MTFTRTAMAVDGLPPITITAAVAKKMGWSQAQIEAGLTAMKSDPKNVGWGTLMEQAVNGGFKPNLAEFAAKPTETSANVPQAAETKPVSTTEAALAAEVARLTALLAAKSNTLTMKVSDKLALSIYGMGRFPVTLYKEQWERLLNEADKIRAFIKAHPELKVKE